MTNPATPPVLSRTGTANVVRVGLPPRPLSDLYHFLLTTSWPALLGLFVVAYFGVNMLFALAYLLDPGGIENARENSFADAFYFSVQTMATIGYGKLVPRTPY